MADTGKTAEQYKMLLRGAGRLDVEPGSPELTSTLRKMRRIQNIWDAAALPIKEVNRNTGREPTILKAGNKPVSTLNVAKNSSAIRAGVERAKTSTPKKTLAPQPLQENTLLRKYDTKPKYSGRKLPKRKPTG